MNVTANPAASSSDSPEPCLSGELVVLNGRLKGTRRALTHPMTLIGQASGCEVRLTIEGVAPLHCAIAQGPDGYVLRDLGSETGTYVNDQRVSVRALVHGDQIVVGPFQFGLEVPESVRPENLRRANGALKAERDALRIQAAAVAAQQAGLTEEEIRLEQRRTALQRQEEQLAARLEQRQCELKEQEEQFEQDRAALQAERQAEQSRTLAAQEEWLQIKSAAEQASQQVVLERQRLVALRKRLKQRWQKHFSAREAELTRREQQLASDQAKLQKGVENLEKERARLTEIRLHFNGEMELGRRRLQEEGQELALAQQQWETTLNQEQAERNRRLRELQERQAAVSQAAEALAQQQNQWAQQRASLEKEVQGLENRIRAQRQRLQELERDSTGVRGQGSDVRQEQTNLPGRGQLQEAAPSSLPPDPWPLTPALLSESVKRVAGQVADQREHLLEQWQRLVQVHDGWEKERLTLLGELEAAGQQLRLREQRLDERAEQIQMQERVLEGRLGQLQQKQESLSQLRCSLEGWQARLTLQASDWEVQREEVLCSVRVREEALAAQNFRAEELHRRRLRRLRKQVREVRNAQQRAEEARLQYAVLWKACQQQHQALLDEQQAVAKQSLALERFRLECLAQVSNQAAAEKRLERLQRDCEALTAEAQRQLERDRQALLLENNRLDEQASTLARLEKELLRQQQTAAVQLTDLENQRSTLAEAEVQRQQQVQRLQTQHRLAEQQLKEVRDEVERLARMLLDEVDAGATPPTSTSDSSENKSSQAA